MPDALGDYLEQLLNIDFTPVQHTDLWGHPERTREGSGGELARKSSGYFGVP
jgi:hypothetical protein